MRRRGTFALDVMGAYFDWRSGTERAVVMRTLERFLIKYTLFLCNLLDVTPQHLEKLRQRKQRPVRPEQRYDYFEA